jgi:hypothetical protein
MTYYCFLCNKNHNDPSTEEHFIPRSISGPEHQWLPVCEASNTRSNSVFDNEVRDILYMARFNNTKILKRTGEALLGSGILKRYTFSYDEPRALKREDAFQYFFDRVSNQKIPSNSVYAIMFQAGLDQKEQEILCRGLAKISIGALTFLLAKEGIKSKKLIRLFSQTSFDSLRHLALNLPWTGNPLVHKFSLGRTDVITRLQNTCDDPLVSNHVVEINFQEKKSIRFEGMLYSKHGWQLVLPSNVNFDFGVLRLENAIPDLPAPENLIDKTLTPDSICIINPDYKGEKPTIPLRWRNNP